MVEEVYDQEWERPPLEERHLFIEACYAHVYESHVGIPVPDDEDDLAEPVAALEVVDLPGDEEVIGNVFAQTFYMSHRDKVLVDSGSVVNTCREDFDPSTKTVKSKKVMRLESIKGELLEHHGFKDGVMMVTPDDLDLKIGFEVTDTTRTVLSVKQSASHGGMTVFAPDYTGTRGSKIITDKDAIAKIMEILKSTRGVTIECENNSYVIDAKVVPRTDVAEWVAPPARVGGRSRARLECRLHQTLEQRLGPGGEGYGCGQPDRQVA